MQQTPTYHRRLYFATLATLLACPAFAAVPPDSPVIFDTEAPTIDPASIPDKSYSATRPIVIPIFNNTAIPAESIDTPVTVSDKVQAGDPDPGVVFEFTPDAKVGPLAPGHYTITWTATDEGLNQATAEQTLSVLPTIDLAPNQTVGEGITATVTAHLSGPAPVYPFNVPYTITGSASSGGVDHDAAAGNFVFNDGETSASVSFSVTDDAIVDPDETVIFTLGALPGASVTAGHKDTHTVTISETNHAPLAQLSANQNGQQTRAVITGDGLVTVSAGADDADGDTVSYDWSASDNALAALTGTTASSFVFDPQGLSPGFYTIRLTVSDPLAASTSHQLLLAVLTQAGSLSSSLDQDDDGTTDADEGLVDEDYDGIPDYIDANSNPALIQGFEPYVFDSSLKEGETRVNNSITLQWSLSARASNLILYPLMIATEPGLRLNLGPTAFAANKAYARLSTAQAQALRNTTLPSGLVSSDGQVVDLEISGLNQAGASVNIVIPQTTGIPPSKSGTSPQLYVYSSNKVWEEFATTGDNQVAANKKDGDAYCPDLTAAYPNPLQKGEECLLLTIADGGPNDYDGEANGTVHFMGGVFITTDSIAEVTTSDSGTFSGNTASDSETLGKLNLGTGDGGGTLNWLTLLGLLLGGILLRRRQ